MSCKVASEYVDNARARECVLAAVRSGEVSMEMLAGEMGYWKPDPNRIRRALGYTKYRCVHTGNMVASKGLSVDLGEYLWETCRVPGEAKETWLAPVLAGYGNGRPMYYAWRLKVLVDKAIADGRTTVPDMARELGHRKPNSNHLRRMLGLKREKGKYQSRIEYSKAEWLCARLGYDPVDWDI